MTYVIIDHNTGLYWNGREQKLSESPSQFNRPYEADNIRIQLPDLLVFADQELDLEVVEF